LKSPSIIDAPPIPSIVWQHLEEATHLHLVRAVLLKSPHVRLQELARCDERIDAHLDGLAVAGSYGTALSLQALESQRPGAIFVTAVGAIEQRDLQRLGQALAIAEGSALGRNALLSAFGWVCSSKLQGLTKALLQGRAPWHREMGLMVCAMHGVDPGLPLTLAAHDPDPGLRACALRAAGRCARRDLLEACLLAMADDDPRCAFEAARAALLLGDRGEAVAALAQVVAHSENPHSLRALRCVLKVAPTDRARAILAALAQDTSRDRAVIQAVAVAGDPHYVPWLITRIGNEKLSRLAGEAFTFITGVDLAASDLLQRPREAPEASPGDDIDDNQVAMDEDDNLPWPDADRISAWWVAHGRRFSPGNRYFMGQVPTPAACLAVLKGGFQRQRIAAAEYLTLLAPGTPLFDTRAPASRQERMLTSMKL